MWLSVCIYVKGSGWVNEVYVKGCVELMKFMLRDVLSWWSLCKGMWLMNFVLRVLVELS